MSEKSPSASVVSTQVSSGTQLKTLRTSSPSPSIAKAFHKPSPREVRFNVCVMMVSSAGASALVCQALIMVHLPGLTLLSQLGVLFLGAFMYEWTWVHSRGLTRARRAYFDETNVLETYQPRARTHGHLFIPDPPTPGPNPGSGGNTGTGGGGGGVTFGEGTEDHNASQNSNFNAIRDAHYANEFQIAVQRAKEMDNLKVTAAAAQEVAPSKPFELKKADVTKPESKKSTDEEKPFLI